MTAYFICKYVKAAFNFFKILCFLVQLIFFIEENMFIYIFEVHF